MRTKTLLLTAAVAAAGVVSTMAQVYSVNTVGYVNVVVKGGGAFTLVANPLDDGTNTLNSIFAGLPNKTSAQTWNGASFDLSTKAGGSFSPNTPVAVGQGVFVRNIGATALTNTFVGNVIPNSGATTTRSLPAGLFTLVGSTAPVSGALNDVGTGTLNLNATIPNKSTVQTWDNSGAGAFVLATKAGGAFSPNSPIAVGQGFFVRAFSATNWDQSLP